jgi:hypothetical protein
MRKAKNIFEPKASRAIRCLLTNPDEAWTIRKISNEANLSVGYTHAVTVTLKELGYIARNESNQIKLVNPIKLLERWASYHQYVHENKFEEYYTFEKKIEEIIKKLGKTNSHYALTTLSGAYIISPYVRPNVVEMYIRDEDQKQNIVNSIELKPTITDGNVRLVHPYDEGVFYKTQNIEDLKIVSNVQLYVDLINYPSRGEEAAQRILEKIQVSWSTSLLGGR